jgi:hypothetical protein
VSHLKHISEQMHDCITRCSDCHDACVESAQHCLFRGGEHAAAERVRTLLDCAQACDTSRGFMLRRSPLHGRTCAVCAEAGERCADSCEALAGDDEVMRSCAAQCRSCAESCRAMATAEQPHVQPHA